MVFFLGATRVDEDVGGDEAGMVAEGGEEEEKGEGEGGECFQRWWEGFECGV